MGSKQTSASRVMVGKTRSDGGVAVAVRAVAFVTACETEVLVMIVNAINISGPNNSDIVAPGCFDFNPFCFTFALLLLRIANLKPTCDFFKEGENDALLMSHLGDRLLLKLRP